MDVCTGAPNDEVTALPEELYISKVSIFKVIFNHLFLPHKQLLLFELTILQLFFVSGVIICHSF